jgi:hypothetical protein
VVYKLRLVEISLHIAFSVYASFPTSVSGYDHPFLHLGCLLLAREEFNEGQAEPVRGARTLEQTINLFIATVLYRRQTILCAQSHDNYRQSLWDK